MRITRRGEAFMRMLTKRFQSVRVATLSSLREYLDNVSGPGCRFTVEKARRDRVTIRGDSSNPEKTSFVVLPSYSTGHEDDAPGNPNVVLDPLEFVNAETHEEREVFVPLLGHDVLTYYERLHLQTGLSMSRCC
jgi:hypothetical protein